MPRYIFEMTCDASTATALVQLAMETASEVAIRTVVEEPASNGRHNKRIAGHTTHGDLLELCRAAANHTVTVAKAEAHFRKMGWNPKGVSPARSRLVSTGKVEMLPNGSIRLTDPSFTAEQLNAIMRKQFKAWREAK